MTPSMRRRLGFAYVGASVVAIATALGMAGSVHAQTASSPPAAAPDGAATSANDSSNNTGAPAGQHSNAAAGPSVRAPAGGPAGAPRGQANSGLQEIVVTARRVNENLQKVPISVGTLNPAALQSRQIFAITDLKGSIAGLTTSTTGLPGGGYFTIRGITTGSLPTPAIDSSIGFYIDGVYIARSEGQGVDIPDLARVEVLRGPQGTLFGRNSSAGAINFVTNNPTHQRELKYDLLYGNYGALRTSIIANEPIGQDLAVRVAYQHNEYDGDVRNTTTRNGVIYGGDVPGFGFYKPARRLGGSNNEAVTAKVRYTGIDGLTLDYKYDYEDMAQSPGANQRLGFLPDGAASGFNGLLGFLYAAQDKALVPQSFKRLGALPEGEQSVARFGQQGHLIVAEYQANDNITLKNITAFRKLRLRYTADLDGSDWTFAPFNPDAQYSVVSAFNEAKQRQYTQENQIIGKFDRFSFIAGGYYFNEHARYSAPTNVSTIVPQAPAVYTPAMGTTQLLPLGPGIPIPSPFAIGEYGLYHNSSIAGYLHAEYDFNNTFKLAAGGRYTKDDRRTQDLRQFAFQGEQKTSFDRFNYDVALNAQLDPSKLLYAKYSTGYVSGGIFSNITFKPEDDRQVEAGFKTEWLNRKLRINGAAYYTWRKNVQTSVPSTNANTNAVLAAAGFTPPYPLGVLLFNRPGTSTVRGFELETTLAPIDGLLLSANVGYNDPHNTDKSLYQAPKLQFAFSGEYDFPKFSNDSYLLLRVDGDYRSKYFGTGLTAKGILTGTVNPVLLAAAGFAATDSAGYDQALLKASTAGDYWLVNGRVSLADVPVGGTKAKISGFVRNVFNTRDLLYVLNYGVSVNGQFERPRTYGLEVNLAF